MNAQLELEGNKPIEIHIFLRSQNVEWRTKKITDEIVRKLNSGVFSQRGPFEVGPLFRTM